MALYNSRGTISEMSEIISGTTKNGNTWQRMELVLEIPGFQGAVYKQVYKVSGNAVDDVMNFKVGDKVEVAFSLYAREWNDKLYNNVDLVKITPIGSAAPAAPAAPTAPAAAKDDDPNNDLPF